MFMIFMINNIHKREDVVKNWWFYRLSVGAVQPSTLLHYISFEIWVVKYSTYRVGRPYMGLQIVNEATGAKNDQIGCRFF